jgi:hypothetical protein
MFADCLRFGIVLMIMRWFCVWCLTVDDGDVWCLFVVTDELVLV